MKQIETAKDRRLFDVLHSSRGAQAAMMTLRPGGASGEKVENEHPWAEQWLFVVSGSGTAIVGRRRVGLRKHSLLLIEKREPHRILNTGRTNLVTLNIYVPPAYRADGELRQPR